MCQVSPRGGRGSCSNLRGEGCDTAELHGHLLCCPVQGAAKKKTGELWKKTNKQAKTFQCDLKNMTGLAYGGHLAYEAGKRLKEVCRFALQASPPGARLQHSEERNEGIFGTHFESSAFIQLRLENPQTCTG